MVRFDAIKTIQAAPHPTDLYCCPFLGKYSDFEHLCHTPSIVVFRPLQIALQFHFVMLALRSASSMALDFALCFICLNCITLFICIKI